MQKKAETKKFFDEMERNIMKRYKPDAKSVDFKEVEEEFDFDAYDTEYPPTIARRGSIGSGQTRLVRTISSLDGKLYITTIGSLMLTL